LGPTKDDITKKAIAEFYGEGFVFSQETFNRIVRFMERLGRTATDGHREQCFMPQNAKLLYNKMGTAPGMWMEEGDTVVVSMPGVPYEMKYLMEYEVIPLLKSRFPGEPILHRTILTVGEGESRIAERIADFENNLPEEVGLSYLPNLGRVRLRLTAKGKSAVELRLLLDEQVERLSQLIPELIFGFEEQTLEGVVGALLKERRLTIGTAESCTGGYLAHQITSVSGSSAYFTGSVIAYSNQVKINQLGVSEETLQQHGAVSEPVVEQMVRGTLELLGTDLAISTSGIAGPTGGTPQKPVGTIWLAVGNREKIVTRKLQLGKDRLKNIQYATVQALNMLRQFVTQ
jgi:nicotinamide-nucleotide amidase